MKQPNEPTIIVEEVLSAVALAALAIAAAVVAGVL